MTWSEPRFKEEIKMSCMTSKADLPSQILVLNRRQVLRDSATSLGAFYFGSALTAFGGVESHDPPEKPGVLRTAFDTSGAPMGHLIQELAASAGEFIAMRRDFHRHPEMGLKEFRTSEIVARNLRAWGYDVTTGLATTGLVAQLRRGNGNKRLGLRADMDALPISEATGLPYASVNPGVMHACGHDGHTAILLAAAKHIAEKGKFSGTLNLIFQPAEEGPGGSKLMIDAGLFEKFPCDSVFGLHNMPGLATGQLVFREGAFLTAADLITVTVKGRGGHGSAPQNALDPIVAASSIVTGLQSIVSRNVTPGEMAVVTVGAFSAGEAGNVITDKAILKISTRSLSEETHQLLKKRITEMAKTQAQSYGLEAEVDVTLSYPVLINSKVETELARSVGYALVGESHVTPQFKPLSGSEDFAFMLQKVKGSYFFIGNGDRAKGGPNATQTHNPGYDFNDELIPIGAAYWVALTERFLQSA